MGDVNSRGRGEDMATAAVVTSCRHKRRMRSALGRIAAVAVAALVIATSVGNIGVSAQTTNASSSSTAAPVAGTATPTPAAATTTSPTTNAGVSAASSSSSSASVGKYVLQRNSKSTDGNTTLEIVHMKDDNSNAQTMVQFAAITSVTDWTLKTWEESVPALEATIKAATPTLTYMELSIQFQQTAAVQNLLFEHDTMWSFGPGLVMDEDALKGLSSLRTLYVALHYPLIRVWCCPVLTSMVCCIPPLLCARKFTKFNVTFADSSWLPSPVALSQLYVALPINPFPPRTCLTSHQAC